ncbi:MAG: hypothetical protein WCG61_06720, partial [Chlorobium sp.]
ATRQTHSLQLSPLLPESSGSVFQMGFNWVSALRHEQNSLHPGIKFFGHVSTPVWWAGLVAHRF